MDVPATNFALIEQLRTWFHPKDRSVYMSDAALLFYLNNGAYLSTAFIAETILSASAASITFSSISQGFRNLLLITMARTDAVAESDAIRFEPNGDTSADYDRLFLTVNSAGVSATATRGATTAANLALIEGASSRGNNFSPGFTILFGYSITNQEKWFINLSVAFGDVSADTDLAGRYFLGRWRNKNPITSLVLVPNTGPNFVSGSRFQLYGVL